MPNNTKSLLLDQLIEDEQDLREQRRHLDEAIGELRDEQAALELQISANVRAQIAMMTAPGCEALDRPQPFEASSMRGAEWAGQ